MAKVVVFGADGFIGRHLVKGLAAQAETEVVAFDRFGGGTDNHAFTDFKNVHVQAGDFFAEADLKQALHGADYAFHLVSTTNPITANANPLLDIDTNIRGSVRLFELAAEAKVKRVLFLSSGGSVYGDVESPAISEDTLPAPRSPYAIGKLTIEHYLRFFRETRGLDSIVYRVANPYGPGQNFRGKQGVIAIFMYHAMEHEPVTIYGDGSMVRDYVYIDDLVRMLVGSYDKPHQHHMYNLGSGHGRSVNEIVAAIEACSGTSLEQKHIEAPATFVHTSVLDMTRFESEFKIRPQTDLETGLKNTWSYIHHAV